ncbi:MAG: hypothetical protein E6G80_15570 [Alphaproteobacteria bacterium]|nr:MAG: hypothetical protein E6G80_15570 [Alphaproteobacteria bacterium]
MTAFTMRIVCFAEPGILADGFVLDLSPFNGSPPARLKPLLLRTFLLTADDEGNGIEQAGLIWAEATFASQNHAGQSQQQDVSSLQISLQACAAACDLPSDT